MAGYGETMAAIVGELKAGGCSADIVDIIELHATLAMQKKFASLGLEFVSYVSRCEKLRQTITNGHSGTLDDVAMMATAMRNDCIDYGIRILQIMYDAQRQVEKYKETEDEEEPILAEHHNGVEKHVIRYDRSMRLYQRMMTALKLKIESDKFDELKQSRKQISTYALECIRAMRLEIDKYVLERQAQELTRQLKKAQTRFIEHDRLLDLISEKENKASNQLREITDVIAEAPIMRQFNSDDVNKFLDEL